MPAAGGLIPRTSVPVTLIFVLFFIYVAVPIVWLIINATKSNGSLFSTFGFWFSDDPQLLTNIKEVFAYDDGIFLIWMRNTVLYATAAAFGAATVSTLAGYAFAVFDFRGKTVLFWAIIATIMVPNTALAVPLFQVMTQVGVINTAWAVILPSIVSPFGVYLMRSYTEQAFPTDLMDAGRVDGASEPAILGRIALPILAPGVATVFLLVFVATWNNFLLPLLVLTDPNLQPITVGLAVWNAQSVNPSMTDVIFTQVITGALLSVIPLILVFILMSRYWRGGLTVGALK